MDPARGAVIFDRDGVLNVDVAYAHRPDQIRWVEDAKAAVAEVNRAGLLALVATNQSGVARGYYKEEDVIRLHDWMNGEFSAAGGRIDAFVYCPHHPEASVSAYRRACACRKPAPGLLEDLLRRFTVAPDHALMVGDQPRDAEAARAAGVRFVLHRGGSLLETLRPGLEDLRTRLAHFGAGLRPGEASR